MTDGRDEAESHLFANLIENAPQHSAVDRYSIRLRPGARCFLLGCLQTLLQPVQGFDGGVTFIEDALESQRICAVMCGSPVVRQGQDRGVTAVCSSPVDESRTLVESVEDLRGHLSDVVEMQHHRISRSPMDCGHPGSGIIEVTHAIDPSVHVPAVEVWEAQDLCEDIVKRLEVSDTTRVDLH